MLQERGDARGEFIPLQLALAKGSARSDPAHFAAMREREGELLSAHAQEWVDHSVPFRCIAYFHRGFVEELQCLAGELLQRGLEVVAPVRVLRLEGDTSAEVAQQVMALRLGSKVRELTLRLVDSAVDGSLRAGGQSLTVLRQLSPEPHTIELLNQLGWLGRLKRLELPLAQDGGALLDEVARLKPRNLEQLWLQRQDDVFGRDVLNAIDAIWAELPALTICWRGVDYRASDGDALVRALDPYRVKVAPSAAGVEAVNLPPRANLTTVMADPLGPPMVSAPMELVPLLKPPPPAEPWDRWLKPEGLTARGFLPRAVPQAVTLLRAEEQGVPVLVALGPVGSFGAVPFAEDIARLMAMPRAPDLLRIERTAMLELARWAVFESFEGVTLWELLRLHPRLPPALVLRVLGQTARAAAKVDGWQPSTDDVLLDVLGRVRLLPGFPRSVHAEESSYEAREERHPLGAAPGDRQAPGAQVVQLGTALFELLTGTPLLDGAGRSTLVRAADAYLLVRQLERGGLSLSSVDPSLSAFEPLLAKATSHSHAERFSGLTGLADALEGHPLAATQVEVATKVREALQKVPRTRDGR